MATPTNIKQEHWVFYVDGRRERKLMKSDIDLDALANTVVTGGKPFREVLYEACRTAAAPLETGRMKRLWLDNNGAAIAEADGDGEGAFRAWLTGRVDELAYALEEEFVVALADLVCGEEDTTGDDEEGEDDEDEGEDDDEEDAETVPPRRSNPRR